MHEYGGGFSPRAVDEALETPLAQAFAMYAACRARYGCLGTGYQEKELLDALSGPGDGTEF